MFVGEEGSTQVVCFGLARTKASRRPSSVFEPARLLMTRAPHGCACDCTNGRMSGRISLAAAPRSIPPLFASFFPPSFCFANKKTNSNKPAFA